MTNIYNLKLKIMFNEFIKVDIKNIYGNEMIYIISEHHKAIKALTGKKTISRIDIENLKSLGFRVIVETKETLSLIHI